MQRPATVLSTLCTLLLVVAPSAAQANGSPGAPDDDRVAKATQELVDSFLEVMPRDPRDLRDPEVRRAVAPKALPVLERVREFAAAHPTSMLAARQHEFTIYALALGADELRRSMEERVERGDADSDLLIRTARVLVAEGDERASAVEACSRALARRKVSVEAAATSDPAPVAARDGHAECSVTCLTLSAALTEAEARTLAERVPTEGLRRRFVEAAERAARDPRRLVGKPLLIEGLRPDGAAFSTASLRGKVVLIDFWATWCRPCVAAMPELVSLRKRHGDRLAVVGVSCDRDGTALAAFLDRHPEYDWPQLFAPDTKWHPIATAHGIESIPRLFLIDREGVLRSADAGPKLAELVRRYVGR